MKKIHCTAINRKITENAAQFINDGERAYTSQIEKIAQSVADDHANKPIVLLSGPSGSGKTTSALLLEDNLDKRGLQTHTISMDDYFLPADRCHAVRNEKGEIDYESPYRLDIELLNDHMLRLANCEEIVIPKFDFADQTRGEGRPLKRKKDELVIFEGIHALNPLVTGLTDSFASCVYVSVRTRIETSSGKLMHPSHIRLMRRLIRDKLFRSRGARETLRMFASVEHGENQYIMPFKYRAHYNVDTFIPYELSVYKAFLENELFEKDGEEVGFDGIPLMLETLRQLEPVSADMIPENSLVREFIGGSRLEY